MSGQKSVVVSRSNKTGIIELGRPDKFNCLSLGVFTEIDAALDEFEKTGSDVRVVLIRAQGKHFCTGADLAEFKSLRDDPRKVAHFVHYGHEVLKRLGASELPVIAACQGLVLAGGSELMMASDVVFAATDCRVGDQHAQFGLLPGWGGSQRMPRAVGLRRSLDMFFSARWIDAATALQWGLVNYVVDRDKLDEAALAYCDKIATRSRGGLAHMKRLARKGIDMSLLDGLMLEEETVRVAMLGADTSEGLAAFEAKREPVFG